MNDRQPPQGLGGSLSLGVRPAVVVVDLTVGFTDPGSPLACDTESCLAATIELLEGARAANAPVAFTTIAYEPDYSDAGPWLLKIPALEILVAGSHWVRIDPRLPQEVPDLIVRKTGASAFHRTQLAAWLREQDIDSLIVVGASTSGCVRATVVDAVQEGWPAFVVAECVADRDLAAHDASLYDIQAKYGEVVRLDGVLRHLKALS